MPIQVPDVPAGNENEALTPGRPRVSLRIGVTGHRLSHLKSLATDAGIDISTLEASLADSFEAVLRSIAAACSDCVGTSAKLYSSQIPLLRVIVGGAFGVDRLAAQVVDERLRAARGQADAAKQAGIEWRLETILPAPLTIMAEAAWPDYIENPAIDAQAPEPLRVYADNWQRVMDRSDCVTQLPATWRLKATDSDATVLEGLSDFPPFSAVERPGADYRLSYAAAADFHLQQIDLLIAFWDGQPSRGPGGVAENAAKALAAGMPVIVVNAAHPISPPRMLKSIQMGPDHPEIVGWTPAILAPVLEHADCRDGALVEAVQAILELPGVGEEADHRHAHSELPLTIEDFLADHAPTSGRSQIYDRFIALMSGRWPLGARRKTAGSRGAQAWAAMAEDVGGHTRLATDLQTLLQQRYRAASALANFYAAQYRSAFVAAFLLGAMAGGVAVFGLAFDAKDWLKVALTLSELVVIYGVFHIVRKGRRLKYHAKYVEYRTLAESLHSLRPLCMLGETPSRAALEAAGGGWHRWYVQATIREIALPDQSLDATYQRRVLKTVALHEIEPEISYHDRNSKIMTHVDHNIHRVGNYLFFIVIIALGVLLSFWLYHLCFSKNADAIMAMAKPWLMIIAIFFPAAGSALAGIRFMADFDGKAARSIQMMRTLQNLAVRAEHAAEKQDFGTARMILRDLAVTLTDDVHLFRTTYGRRELVLPS